MLLVKVLQARSSDKMLISSFTGSVAPTFMTAPQLGLILNHKNLKIQMTKKIKWLYRKTHSKKC